MPDQQQYTQLSEASSNIEESEKALIGSEELLLEMMRKRRRRGKKMNEADQAYYNLRNALQEKESELR
jgi:chromosome segregation protein